MLDDLIDRFAFNHINAITPHGNETARDQYALYLGIETIKIKPMQTPGPP